MNVPYMGSTNLFATPNYKDIFFLAWSGYTQVGIYSLNETPIRNTKNISATPTTTSCQIRFTERGVGNKVAVFIKSGTYTTPITSDGSTYTANTIFGSGTQIGTSGWYCAYNDIGETFTVSGLTNGNTYQVQAVEYNGLAGAEMYIDNTATSGNPITFTTGVVLPVNFSNISACRKNNNVLVTWRVDNEINIHHYELESSLDGRNFIKVSELPATGISNYNMIDYNATKNALFYRVKSLSNTSDVKYSETVKINAALNLTNFIVAPNPITNNEINLQFKNQPAGIYKVQVFNNLGILLKITNINI
jgi:hypothetical protein